MGLFTNANKVMIGNKEVKSIKIGTSTLYEKSDGGSSSNILFDDPCSSNANLSKYGTPVNISQTSNSGTPTMEYDSSNSAYALYGTSSSDYVIYPIPVLDGLNDFTLSCEIKLNNSTSYPYVGLGVMPSASSLSSTYADTFYIYRYNATQVNAYVQKRRRTNKSSNSSTGRITHTPTNWLRLKAVFNNSNDYTVTWEEVSSGSVLKTYTGTVTTSSVSDRHYGIYMRCYTSSYKGYIRNVKAERNS